MDIQSEGKTLLTRFAQIMSRPCTVRNFTVNHYTMGINLEENVAVYDFGDGIRANLSIEAPVITGKEDGERKLRMLHTDTL